MLRDTPSLHPVLILAALLSLISVLLTPGTLQADDRGWTLRLSAVYADPDLTFDTVGDDGQRIRVEQDSAFGLALRAEYRLSPRWGVELGAMAVSNDLSIRVDNTGFGPLNLGPSVRMTPWTAGLLLHLTPQKRVDFYVAARAAYVIYDDVVLEDALLGRERQNADDDLGWSLGLGLDVPVGEGPWAAHFEIAHLDTVLELTAPDGFETRLAPEPLLIHAGVSYRF